MNHCDCSDPLCGVIFVPNHPDPGTLTVQATPRFWTLVQVALSEIADADSSWAGSQKLYAARAI